MVRIDKGAKAMPLRAYVIGEPELIERPDGCYIEVCDGEGIHSAGPMTREKAEEMLRDVREEMERS